MDVDSVMSELAALATEGTRRNYLSRGVREPLFGVPTGAMNPLKKKIGVDQQLANDLWDTGNFDAMYFAGMIADLRVMTESDFEHWIDGAYASMLSDFVVAVTLAESDFATSVADRWIRSEDESRASAGWACYEWLLGWRPDTYFEQESVRELLGLAAATIHSVPGRVARAMNNFIVAVGVSYLPLAEEALRVAKDVGAVTVVSGDQRKTLGSAADQIRKAAEKGRLGFKRRAVRC